MVVSEETLRVGRARIGLIFSFVSLDHLTFKLCMISFNKTKLILQTLKKKAREDNENVVCTPYHTVKMYFIKIKIHFSGKRVVHLEPRTLLTRGFGLAFGQSRGGTAGC